MDDFPTPTNWYGIPENPPAPQSDAAPGPPPPPPAVRSPLASAHLPPAPSLPPPPMPPSTVGSPYSAFGVTTPPAAWVAPQHTPPKKSWSAGKILALVGLLGVLIVGGLIVIVVGTTELMATAVDSSVPPSAEIGDCYERFGSLQRVDCNGIHHYEVYDVIVYPANASYPGRLERLAGDPACTAGFEWYTGESYWTSEFDYSIPLPSQDEWAAGERRTVCVLHHTELQALVGTRDRS